MIKKSLTIKELKDYVKDLPETDNEGDDYTVWIMISETTSTPVSRILSLNEGDIVFEPQRTSNDRN